MGKIIKKRLLLIVSMLAVTFALAGCTSSDKKVEFKYDKKTLVQTVKDQAQQYMSMASVDEIYNYAVDEDASLGSDESVVDAIKVFATLNEDYGDFVKFTSDYNVEEVDDKVAVSVYAPVSYTHLTLPTKLEV